jgi:uncharacterized protein (DUF1697 family)
VTTFVALLRAVNVGGRQLKMAELKRIADECGLGSPRTYIASGNLLFTSADGEEALKKQLERAITAHMGKTVEVMIRTAAELAQVVEANPFTDEPGNRVAAIFFDQQPGSEAIDEAKNRSKERLARGKREIYVHYPDGLGASKLQLGTKAAGTARNMNTVAKLAELAREMS